MNVVTCNGCFDGLHPGHLMFLSFIRGAVSMMGQDASIVVGINCDDYIARKKRPFPHSASLRIRDLMETGIPDRVEVFEEDNPIEFIRKNRPVIHFIGEEYMGNLPEEDVCRELGVRMQFVPRVGDWSSTKLRG